MSRVATWSEIEPALAGVDLLEEMSLGFQAYSAGDCVVPPVGELLLEESRGEVHIKYGYVRGGEHYVIKIASGFPGNPALGLPVGDGLMLLFRQDTGALARVLFDEGHLTDERTAAAGALASRTMAPPTVERIGILGAGVQARLQAKHHAGVFPDAEFMVWGRDAEKSAACAAELSGAGIPARSAEDVERLSRECQVIVTTTAAKESLLASDWVQPGTHVTAVGSDTPEKQEVEVTLLARADKVACDSLEQCRLRGEVSQALRAGAISEEEVVELGAILSGDAAGRGSSEEVTVCDLTGVAVQDLRIAEAVNAALA
ncbi:MAG: ornithine cyclodeaminase family protein [Planctomycetes bacterium]|nr:ornithine cyclodeaminase family protein [Planctomycetota bacterium]